MDDALDLAALLKAAASDPLPMLQELVAKKYQLILAYIHYGDQLRSIARDGVFAHFQEHLEEERGQAYQLNKKITALGGDARATHPDVPAAALGDAKAVLEALLAMEEKSVKLWTRLFEATKEDVALNSMAQNYAQECQGHADDMKRYLRAL